jgi:hypothetical protein
MSRTVRSIVAVVVLLLSASSALAALPEPMTSVFFNTVKKYHPNPDSVELARYLVYHPEHAAPIYSKLAGQDYVLASILASAKAAKGLSIQGVGKFDYERCTIPTKAFDAVFLRSSEFVQSQSQNPSVKAYTAAATEQAKAQAAAQLASAVPYWGDIPHICHFTFNTDLQKEKQIRETISSGVTTIKDAYSQFAGGDIVDGVKTLIAAGVTGDVACSLADQMISGGYIGKVPVLGDLAKSACSSFGGTIIKGVSAAGETAVGAVSNLGDALAGQEKHIPTQAYYDQHWKPRIAEGAARLRAGTYDSFLKDMWEPCADYFDSHTMSRANAQETCDYHRDVLFGPAVNAFIAAEDEVVRRREEIVRQIPLWDSAYFALWYPQCWDTLCEQKIKSFRGTANEYAQAKKNQYTGGPGWPAIEAELQSFHEAAKNEVAASKQRFADVNKQTTKSASAAWETLTRDGWTPRCWDKPCRVEIDNLARGMGAAARVLQLAKPEESSLAIQNQVAAEYAPKLKKAIDDSEGRRIVADPNAAPVDKLPRLGCKSFLGRAGQWVCNDPVGFNACAAYVRKGAAEECRLPATSALFASERQMTAALQAQNCQRSGSSFQCATDKAKSICEQYRSGGMVVGCVGPGDRVLALPSRGERRETTRRPASRQITLVTDVSASRSVPPPIRIVSADRDAQKEAAAKALSDQGCRTASDRGGDFVCNTDAAMQACEGYVRRGVVASCRRAARRGE